MARHTTGGADGRMLRVAIPGRDHLTLHHLVLDRRTDLLVHPAHLLATLWL